MNQKKNGIKYSGLNHAAKPWEVGVHISLSGPECIKVRGEIPSRRKEVQENWKKTIIKLKVFYFVKFHSIPLIKTSECDWVKPQVPTKALHHEWRGGSVRTFLWFHFVFSQWKCQCGPVTALWLAFWIHFVMWKYVHVYKHLVMLVVMEYALIAQGICSFFNFVLHRKRR